MATTIDRTNYNALVDDDGSGTVGTVWNKYAIDVVILDPVDALLAANTGVTFGGPVTERGRSLAMGVWQDVPYDANNFTAPTGSWTVESGDVVTYRYMLIGETMFLSLILNGTTVGGTPAHLRVAVPGGFTIAKQTQAAARCYDNGTETVGFLNAAPADATFVKFFRGGFSNWATSTNATTVQGFAIFPVQ